MLSNYLRTAWRTLWRDRSYTLINLFGLGLGLGCALILLLYVRHELSFDTYHDAPEQIYRIVNTQASIGAERLNSNGPPPMGPFIRERLPAVQQMSRVNWQGAFVRVGTKDFVGQNAMFADAEFFELFRFPALAGNVAAGMRNPDAVLLTATAADRYFGTTDVVGKTLALDNSPRIVAAVLADPPANTFFQFDFLVPFLRLERDNPGMAQMWNTNWPTTFVRLAPGTDPAAFSALLEATVAPNQGPAFDQITYRVMPLAEVHFNNQVIGVQGRVGNRNVLYGLLAAAVFLLVIGCINYVNLATARAGRRAREVGVRKLLGAWRRQLVAQFTGEALLVLAGALLLALLVAQLGLPWFNARMGQPITLGSLFEAGNLLWLGALLLVLLLATGVYPALYLSRFTLAAAVKGERGLGSGHRWVRGLLVVFQFGITALVGIFFYTIYRQLDFLVNKDLGFAPEQYLSFTLRTESRQNATQVRSLLSGQAGVEAVGFSTSPPTLGGNTSFIHPKGMSDADNAEYVTLQADPYYVPAMGFRVVAGRNLRADIASDTLNAVLLNEKAARVNGWTPEEAVGKELVGWNFSDSLPARVVGVVADFHNYSAKSPIYPMIMAGANWDGAYFQPVVRFDPRQTDAVLAHLEEVARQLAPNQPFQPQFLSERFARAYRAEQTFSEIMGVFAGISLLLAAVGLLGLSAYLAQLRRREMAIRKVMGAAPREIVRLLAVRFVYLVVLANVLAAGLGYWVTEQWLDGFAFRAAASVVPYLLGLLATLAVTLLVTGVTGWGLSRVNPTESLRTE